MQDETINKNKDAFQAKELQKILNKVKGLVLIKATDDFAFNNMPTLLLIMDEIDFRNAKDYGINKMIENLLDNKYPVLHLDINENSALVKYYIMDDESGLTINLIEQGLTQALIDFLKNTTYQDKIAMVLAALKKDGSVVLDSDPLNNILLIIDGYFIEQ